MLRNWKFVLIPLVLLAATLACSLSGKDGETPARPVTNTPPPLAADTPPPPVIETQPSAPPFPTDSGWAKRGDAAVWPDYIPDDIPELEGKIRLVMEAPQSHVRIFYEDMTREQIDQYLRLLKQEGFQLDYIVYVQEGFPDNSEERLKKGDYDAVDITRGDYHMNIGYGEGNISYDIYISGFQIPTKAAYTTPTFDTTAWPADLYRVPQPERCSLINVEQIPPQDYRITCRPDDDEVAGAYKQALQTAGFMPNINIPASDGSLDGSIYAWGNLEISVDQPSSGLLLITISDTSLKKSTWPTELAGIVPQPQGCTVSSTTRLPDGGFSIVCDGEGDQIRMDYIDLLLSEGFVETSRMESQTGELLSMNLAKGSLQVTLLLGAYPGIVLSISGNP